MTKFGRPRDRSDDFDRGGTRVSDRGAVRCKPPSVAITAAPVALTAVLLAWLVAVPRSVHVVSLTSERWIASPCVLAESAGAVDPEEEEETTGGLEQDAVSGSVLLPPTALSIPQMTYRGYLAAERLACARSGRGTEPPPTGDPGPIRCRWG
jgi:hypothetical protein